VAGTISYRDAWKARSGHLWGSSGSKLESQTVFVTRRIRPSHLCYRSSLSQSAMLRCDGCDAKKCVLYA
jgi:hypothetical protein